MRILVTGKNGQLGSEIAAIAENFTMYEFFFTGSSELNISDTKEVNNFFDRSSFDAIVNCAAYTAVDKAEDEVDLAYSVNHLGVKNLVDVCIKYNMYLIHISTDYVFDGAKNVPYIELDKVNPSCIYGKSKRMGEEVILNSSVKALIIRTSWVFSNYGNNFVKTIMRLGKEKESIGVIFDQIGTPTYAGDLAVVCIKLLQQTNKWDVKSKVYHFSNEGVASWYDFAFEIIKIYNLNCKVLPIETSDYPSKVERPQFSVLNKKKIKEDFGIEICHWKQCLNLMLS